MTHSEGYRRLLASPAWERTRRACFASRGWNCAVCGQDWRKRKGGNLQAHHLHYRTLGREDPTRDLIPLCDAHHPRGRLSAYAIGQGRTNYLFAKGLDRLLGLLGRFLLLVFKGLFAGIAPPGRGSEPGRRQ